MGVDAPLLLKVVLLDEVRLFPPHATKNIPIIMAPNRRNTESPDAVHKSKSGAIENMSK